MRAHAVIIAVALTTLCPAGAALAQTTDLSYRAAEPLELRYASADTTETVMDGMPMGSMTSSMKMTLTYAVSMSAAGDSTRVRVATESPSVVIEAMGQTQRMDEQFASAPAEFVIGRTGLSQDVLAMDDVDVQGAMSTGFGQATAGGVLLLLPGREVSIGETWTDTLAQRGSISGLDFDLTIIIHGTYLRDTTVAGARHNVLHFVTSPAMTSKGNMQGMDIEQRMIGERAETVLWDPARHIVVRRRHTTNMTMHLDMPMAGGTMIMRMRGSGALDLSR